MYSSKYCQPMETGGIIQGRASWILHPRGFVESGYFPLPPGKQTALGNAAQKAYLDYRHGEWAGN